MTHPTNPQTIADRRRLDVRSCSRVRPAYAAAMRATPGKSAIKAIHPKMPALNGPSGPSRFKATARIQVRFVASRMAEASHSRVAESPRDRSKFLLYDKLRSFPGPPDSGTASKEFWLQGAWATISRTRAVREAILYRRRRVLDLSRRGRWRACRVSQSLVRHAVHPGLQGVVGRVDVEHPRLVRVLDDKALEDDLLPLPTKRDAHARDGKGAPRFDEPRFKCQGQGVPLFRYTIAAHAIEPRGEPRIRRRDRPGRGPSRDPSLHAHRPSESAVHWCGICCLWTGFCRPEFTASARWSCLAAPGATGGRSTRSSPRRRPRPRSRPRA